MGFLKNPYPNLERGSREWYKLQKEAAGKEAMATKTDEILSIVESLPIELKIKLIERILNTLHPTSEEMDELWAREVEKRLQDVKTGRVKLVAAEEVFEEIRKRYSE